MSCYYVSESVNLIYVETGFGVKEIKHEIMLNEGDIVGVGMTYAMVNFEELDTVNFGVDVIILNEAELSANSVRITSNDYDRFKENHYFKTKFTDAMVDASEDRVKRMQEQIDEITGEDNERIAKILSKTYRSRSELLKKYDKELALSYELEKEINLKKKELDELNSHLERIRHDIRRMVVEEGDVAKIIPTKGYNN